MDFFSKVHCDAQAVVSNQPGSVQDSSIQEAQRRRARRSPVKHADSRFFALATVRRAQPRERAFPGITIRGNTKQALAIQRKCGVKHRESEPHSVSEKEECIETETEITIRFAERGAVAQSQRAKGNDYDQRCLGKGRHDAVAKHCLFSPQTGEAVDGARHGQALGD